MDRMVARLNIDHYEHLLEKETNEAERERLRRLLAVEKLRKAELEHDRKRKRD